MQYGALLIVDPEEENYPQEVGKLAADVAVKGLGLIVVGEWYNVDTMVKMRFFDDNTRSWWTPATGRPEPCPAACTAALGCSRGAEQGAWPSPGLPGVAGQLGSAAQAQAPPAWQGQEHHPPAARQLPPGRRIGSRCLAGAGGANLPALNELLAPFGVAFGDAVLEGPVQLGGDRLHYASGANIVRFPAGGTVHSAPLADKAVAGGLRWAHPGADIGCRRWQAGPGCNTTRLCLSGMQPRPSHAPPCAAACVRCQGHRAAAGPPAPALPGPGARLTTWSCWCRCRHRPWQAGPTGQQPARCAGAGHAPGAGGGGPRFAAQLRLLQGHSAARRALAALPCLHGLLSPPVWDKRQAWHLCAADRVCVAAGGQAGGVWGQQLPGQQPSADQLPGHAAEAHQVGG